MKEFEEPFTSHLVSRENTIIARLDGRGFSRFTKCYKRPYDPIFRKLMMNSLLYLMKEFHAKLGYTQSDEISLAWIYNEEQEPLFGGKLYKINSILASAVSAFFNVNSGLNKLAHFDCRTFEVPKEKSIDYFIDRREDCVRNSIQMLARHHFSHKQIDYKTQNDMLEMLLELGIDWNQSPAYFKHGVFCFKKQITRNNALRSKLCLSTHLYPAVPLEVGILSSKVPPQVE